VKPGGHLALSAGTYFFNSLTLEANAELRLPNNNAGVVLYVRDNLILRGKLSGGSAEAFLLGYWGTGAVAVESSFAGTLVAPNAPVRFAVGGVSHSGSAFAKSLELDPGVRFTFRPFAHWNEVLPKNVVEWKDAPVILRATRDHQTQIAEDGTAAPSVAVDFDIPSYIPVTSGNASNGTAELTFKVSSTATVKCTYRGGSSVSHPLTELDAARGRRYKFVSCSNGQNAGDKARGTAFTLKVKGGDAGHRLHRTAVEANLGKGCSGSLPPPLFPEEVVQLRQGFSWRTMPRLPEVDPHGRPALRYGLIYIERKSQLADLDRLGILWSAQPLLRQDITAYDGKCGRMEHASDGKGVFVFGIFLAKTFNHYRAAGIRSAVTGVAPPILAMIPYVPEQATVFNSDGSLSYQALGASGYYQWLVARRGQQPNIFGDAWDWTVDNVVDPVVDAGEDIAGYAADTWNEFADWSANAVDNVWETTQNLLGELAKEFAGRVTVTLDVKILNRDPAFDTTSALVRGWGGLPTPRVIGVSAGTQIVPHSAYVVVKQWWGEVIPVRSEERLPEDGRVEIVAVQGGKRREGGLCIELETDHAWMTTDLIPDEICDFYGPNFDAFERDTTSTLSTNHDDLHALTQITDGADYAQRTIGYDPHKVQVLTGFLANEASSILNGAVSEEERAMTLCLDFPGAGIGAITNLVGQMSAPLLADIWWPDERNAVPNLNSRGIMTHEYGHFLMCSMLYSHGGPSGIDALIPRVWAGESSRDSIGVMCEAFADYFASQVAGGTNYFAPPAGVMPSNRMAYCVSPPCIERNLKGTTDAVSDNVYKDEIGRTVSLINDAFDRDTSNGRGIELVPWNGDVWFQFAGKLRFSPTPYIATADEPVHLTGFGWSKWVQRWFERGATPTREHVLGGLSDALKDEFNWCQRCEAFAVHNSTVPLILPSDEPVTPLDHWRRWNSCLVDGLGGILGDAPDPFGNIDSSCRACPPGQFPIAGACTPCPSGLVPRGDHCDGCSAGQVPGPDNQCHECPTGQIAERGVCVPCGFGLVANATKTACVDCPADAVVDASTIPDACSGEMLELVLPTAPVAGDLCPNETWVEVRNADALVGRVRPSFGLWTNAELLSELPELACAGGNVTQSASRRTALGAWSIFATANASGHWSGCSPPPQVCVDPGCAFRDPLLVPLADIQAGLHTVRYLVRGTVVTAPVPTKLRLVSDNGSMCPVR
jgi:hypothetical protein